jgi:hypothetical protein
MMMMMNVCPLINELLQREGEFSIWYNIVLCVVIIAGEGTATQITVLFGGYWWFAFKLMLPDLLKYKSMFV